MRRTIVSSICLGLFAWAGSGVAQQQQRSDVTRGSSTYTPGRGGEETPQAFSQRGSAIAPARGGGPGRAEQAESVTPPAPVRETGAGVELHSDNQTRRPGAQNYTGASFESARRRGDARGQHRVASEPGVGMTGDDFRGRTGSATTGRIPVRAPSSDESLSRPPAPAARGGGPAAPRRNERRNTAPGPRSDRGGARVVPAGPRVALPDGQVATLAASDPITWQPSAAPPVIDAPVLVRDHAVTREDLAYIDGDPRVAPRSPGLLALDPTVRGTDLLDTTEMVSAAPHRFNLELRYPAMTRAIAAVPAIEAQRHDPGIETPLPAPTAIGGGPGAAGPATAGEGQPRAGDNGATRAYDQRFVAPRPERGGSRR